MCWEGGRKAAAGAAPCPAMGLRFGASDGEVLPPRGFGASLWGCAGAGELGGMWPLQAEELGGRVCFRAMV